MHKTKWLADVCAAVLVGLLSPRPALGVSSISELDSIALFHFSIMSDNKGDATENSNVKKWDSWARSGEFCLGVGDNLQVKGEPFLPFISSNTFWKTKFLPNIGDGENQHFSGDQAKWGSGWEMFNSFPNFFTRSDVVFRPLTTLSRDRKVDYRYTFQKGGFTVTAFQLHMSDSYDGSMNPAYGGLSHVSSNWLISELDKIRAVGKSDRHIVIVLVQTDIVQNWLDNAPAALKTAIFKTADLAIGASTHRYGWLTRYKDTCNKGKGPVVYNSGSCGYSPSTQGYMEIHVLDYPPRFTVCYINTEHNATRLLHVGVQKDWMRNTDNGVSVPDQVGTPVVKQINGPYAAITDWTRITVTPPVGIARAALPATGEEQVQFRRLGASRMVEFEYTTEENVAVSLMLFDCQGRVLYRTAHSMVYPGRHQAVIPAASLRSGMYYLYSRIGDKRAVNKIIVE